MKKKPTKTRLLGWRALETLRRKEFARECAARYRKEQKAIARDLATICKKPVCLELRGNVARMKEELAKALELVALAERAKLKAEGDVKDLARALGVKFGGAQ